MGNVSVRKRRIHGPKARLRNAAIRKERRCKSLIRLFGLGALITTAPFVDAYTEGMGAAQRTEKISFSNAIKTPEESENAPTVIYLTPKMKGNESPETVIKRMKSEKIIIVLPPEYVNQNKDAVGSMKKAAYEAQKEAEDLIKQAINAMPTRIPAMDNAGPERHHGQIQNWLERRSRAFSQMASVFPKSLEDDYGARKNGVRFAPPPWVNLGQYRDYVKKSIGIACVFFYRERWKEMADRLAANIDWDRVCSSVDVMIAMRDGRGEAGTKLVKYDSYRGIDMTVSVPANRKIIRPNLSNRYLAMVAVLADAMEQLTGVERSTLLALMTQETGMDHEYYTRKGKGICQLTRGSPLFSYAAYNTYENKRELENVMKFVLPEKDDFGNARIMMAGLFDAIQVKDDRQGDITMNMMAGALNYRYNYYMNTGTGLLSFTGRMPTIVSYCREAVQDYNGTASKAKYALLVERHWQQYRKALGRLASAQKGPGDNMAASY
jgi:hypothetical protein